MNKIRLRDNLTVSSIHFTIQKAARTTEVHGRRRRHGRTKNQTRKNKRKIKCFSDRSLMHLSVCVEYVIRSSFYILLGVRMKESDLLMLMWIRM